MNERKSMKVPPNKSPHEHLVFMVCMVIMLHSGTAEAFRPRPYNPMHLSLVVVAETGEVQQNLQDGHLLKNPIRLQMGALWRVNGIPGYFETDGYAYVLLVDGIYWSWLPNGGIYWFGDIIRRPPPPPRDYVRHSLDEWLDGKVQPPNAEPRQPFVFTLQPGKHTIRAVTLDIEGNLAEPRSLSNAVTVTVE
jgi:hypothetical protein